MDDLAWFFFIFTWLALLAYSFLNYKMWNQQIKVNAVQIQLNDRVMAKLLDEK